MNGTDLLERRLDRFNARHHGVSECADGLRDVGIRICSFENLTTEGDTPVSLVGPTLRQVLDEIVARSGDYRWDEPSSGLFNLFPRDSVLESPVPAVAVRSKGAWRVLNEDLSIGMSGITLFQEFGDPDGPPVDLDLEGADLRAALNVIVSQLEPLVWHIAGRPGQYHLGFTAVDVR